MNQITKVCKNHGQLEFKDIFVRKNRATDCRICKNESQTRRRFLDNFENLTERKCSHCQQIKKRSEFKSYDFRIRYPYCAICRRKNSAKEYTIYKSHLKRYNLTPEQYNDMLIAQNHACAICKMPETAKAGRKNNSSIRKLSVDHNHTTGKTRQLLCHTCNVAVGAVKESAQLARDIATYIENHL